MIRKVLNLSFLLILLIVNGCGFKPMLAGSDYDFSIKVKNSSGNEEINSKIQNKLKMLNGTKRTFDLNINSNETKNILSKDSKGDPTILEIVISLNYKLVEKKKILVNKSLTQKSTYNNISDKFELSKSEEMLKDNLVENLVSEIINSASNFLQSSKINDN